MSILSQRAVLLDFIRTYKSFPALWDCGSEVYLDRNLKAEAYDVLAKILGQIEENVTRALLVSKINSLRCVFNKEHRKVVESKLNGGPVYEPKVWYYKELLFLETRKHKPRRKNKYIPTQLKQEPTEEIHFVFDTEQEELVAPYLRTQNIEQRNGHSYTNKLKGDPYVYTNNYNQNTSSCNNQPIEDEYQIMGRAYAEKLKKMSRMQMLFADRVINEILLEGQMGNLTRWTSINLSPEESKAKENNATILESNNLTIQCSDPLQSNDMFEASNEVLIQPEDVLCHETSDIN